MLVQRRSGAEDKREQKRAQRRESDGSAAVHDADVGSVIHEVQGGTRELQTGGDTLQSACTSLSSDRSGGISNCSESQRVRSRRKLAIPPLGRNDRQEERDRGVAMSPMPLRHAPVVMILT